MAELGGISYFSPRSIRNAWLCQVDDGVIAPLFSDLYLEDGRIKEVRPADFRACLQRLSQRKPDRAQENREIDAEGRVATPPLVNFHEHLYSRLAKGLNPGGPMDSFLHILKNLWWKLDQALDAPMVEACAQLGALEAIRSGVTCLFDHHASPGYIEGSLENIAQVLSDAGLRCVLCFETSDRYGPEGVRAALQENGRFLREHREGDIQGMLGLHAPFTLNDGTLREAAALCRELQAGIHIHLAEDRHELQHSRSQHGLCPAERLQRFGLLSPRSILAHCIHLEPEDRTAIAERGSAVAYNPDSNLNNAVGLPAFPALAPSVPILAGTDGMHANAARTQKQLFLLSRHQGNSPAQSFQWLQKIFFDQILFVRRYFPDYPSLRFGDRADLVLWDYRPPTPFTKETFWGHYIYGILESSVSAVVQAGKLLLFEGRILSMNEPSVCSAAALQGERLFERLGVPAHG